MHSLRAPDVDVPPFETEKALSEWLRSRGLEHVLRVGMAALIADVEAALMPQFRSVSGRRRLVELLYVDGVARWAAEALPSPRMKTLLPLAAARWLAAEEAGVNEARSSLPARLCPPQDDRTHCVHRLLLALRDRWPPSSAPRPLRALALEGLQLDAELPGFHYRGSRFPELPAGAPPGSGFILPDARLSFSPDAVAARCSCGGEPCVHGLAAVDAVLFWLHQPWSETFGETLEALVRPAWERALRALERAVEESGGVERGAAISWRLRVIDGYGVEVAPYVHRRTQKGQRTAGARLNRRRLMLDYGARLSPEDARLAALLPEGEGAASQALLFALVDHPRIGLDHAPEEAVRIDRAKVGLVAEDRGGEVVVTAGVDGAALPPPMLERLRRARPDEAQYLWEEGSRRLTVLDAGPEVRALLASLNRHGNSFPPESHGALLDGLARLALRIPVALPRTIMGEAVPPEDTAVVRLEAHSGGAVRVELRTRPLKDGPSFTPGEGVRDVHVRREARAVHAVRDLAREKASAESLQSGLPLKNAEPLDGVPFAFLISDLQACLHLLATCDTLQPKPELEWVGPPIRLLGARGLPALKVTLEKKRDWFGVLGGLDVQGERVELARLLDAARRQERFVRVNARDYVEIEAALREHLAKLSDHTRATRHGVEVGPSAVEVLTGLEDAGAKVEADPSWQRLVERIFAAKELKPRVPGGLRTELRDYQVEGFRWMTRLASWGAGAVLADDMGLGKTIQALAVLLDRRRLGPALVLAPTSVAFNWIDEAKRFAPTLRFLLFADAPDRGGMLQQLGPGDVLVLSYGLLTRDVERLSKVAFATLVFDEAQTLKNAHTHRFRAARALQGDFKVALSGTPLENHLGELWGLFAVVFPGLLGSWEAFRSRFATPIEKGLDPTAAPALARVLQPFLLRRTKAQVEAQLPARTDVRVPVVLSPAEWTLYEDARLAALSDLEARASVLRDQERRVEVLAALTRLRLLASHPRLYDPRSKLQSAKLERFMELVRELRAEGHRALVFSQFTSHLALVREVLDAEGVGYEYLDGSTPHGARAERVRAFQEGTAPLFLISLKAGGFGLNLTAATSVIHLDPWWNPAVEDQASDRAHRIGQARPVTVYRLVARGTIEEQMLALHAHKRALVEGVLEGKDAAARLSTRELLGMLAQGVAPSVEGIPMPATRH